MLNYWCANCDALSHQSDKKKNNKTNKMHYLHYECRKGKE